MARRAFDVIDIGEILVHWHAGRSKKLWPTWNRVAGYSASLARTVRIFRRGIAQAVASRRKPSQDIRASRAVTDRRRLPLVVAVAVTTRPEDRKRRGRATHYEGVPVRCSQVQRPHLLQIQRVPPLIMVSAVGPQDHSACRASRESPPRPVSPPGTASPRMPARRQPAASETAKAEKAIGPRNTLRIPPGSTGNTTGRLAAQPCPCARRSRRPARPSLSSACPPPATAHLAPRGRRAARRSPKISTGDSHTRARSNNGGYPARGSSIRLFNGLKRTKANR